jgi:hypothetical protein
MRFYLVLGLLLSNIIFSMNFVTVADNEYFEQAAHMIGTLYQHNGDHVNAIAVFDIGLTQEQKNFFNSLAKVTVFDVEKKNPFMFEHFVVRNKGFEAGRTARGWYTWKPVVFKQAADMFDDFIYIDAGMSIVRCMLPLYAYLKMKGYFFIDCGHDINRMVTKKVRQEFQLDLQNNSLVHKTGLAAGYQGITKIVYDNYIMPMYQLAEDITLFEDDGSAPRGFGEGRHDQALFSIFAWLNNYYIFGRYDRAMISPNESISPRDFISFTRNHINLSAVQHYLRFK